METSDDGSGAASFFRWRFSAVLLSTTTFDSSCHCQPRRFFFLSLFCRMHTPDRCRWGILHESTHDHDRILSAVGFAVPTRAMALIDDRRDLFIENSARRQGWLAAQTLGVSLLRSRVSFSRFSSLLLDLLDFLGWLQAKLFLSSSFCREKLLFRILRDFFKPTKFFVLLVPQRSCWSFRTSSGPWSFFSASDRSRFR